MTLSRRITSALAMLFATGALAACGSSDNNDSSSSDNSSSSTTQSSGGGGGDTLALEAQENGGLRFDKKDLTAKSGSVTITIDNPSGNSQPHAVEVEGKGVEEESDIVSPGSNGKVTVDLKPGKYEFYCPVGDHRQQGMEGTLTVN